MAAGRPAFQRPHRLPGRRRAEARTRPARDVASAQDRLNAHLQQVTAVPGMTESKLKSIVDRIERLEEQQKTLLAKERGIYLEAEKAGYDIKALRRIVAERRMPDREQIVAKMQAYRVMLGMAVNDVAIGATVR